MSPPQLLWRKVLAATVDTLRGRSRGQYDIRLARPRGIEDFFAGLPRVPTDLGGYNVQVPIAPVKAPVSVPATSITVAYIGPDSARDDWRIPSQRPESAYPLWREGVGLLPHTEPGEDFVVLVRDPDDVFHARWLRGDDVGALPSDVAERLERGTAGVEQIDASEWHAVAEVLAIPADQRAEELPLREKPPPHAAGEPYRPEDEAVATPQPDPFKIDPDVMDRGIAGHRRTQNALAAFLEEQGVTALSHRPQVDPAFDLAWRDDNTLHVAEVKSATDANEEKQLRLAVGQVLRYVHQLGGAAANVHPVIAIERKPSDASWIDLCRDLGIRLMWPGAFAV